MQMITRTTAFILAFCILFCLAACQKPVEPTSAPSTVPTTAEPTTVPPTTEAPNEGLLLYQAARDVLENQENVGLVISVTQTMTFPAEQLVKNIHQDISYVGLGTADFKAVVQDTSGTGTGKLRNKETFSGGKVYIRASDEFYLVDMTEEEYIARYLPIVLIDENLYETIDYIPGDYTSEVRFANPTAPESWFPGNAEVLEASGTAVLGTEGKLKKFTYDVTFSVLGAKVRQEISIVVTTPQVTHIEVPDDTSYYLSIPHPDIPKLADLAYFYATSATSISATVVCETVSEAGAIRVVDTEELETYDNGSYMAQVDFTREYTDLQTLETGYYSQQQIFRKNIYSISTNGGKAENDIGVDRWMMQDYIYDEVNYGWVDYAFMKECAAASLGNVLLIEFRGIDELALAIEDNISAYLFEDEAFLDDLASKYETVQMDYYIAIDTYFGLPTAAGFSYAGCHVIDGTEYMTSRTVSATMHLASNESHKAITGEPMPDDEETESPTPLFYHVTGKNGEEMWLLGTIHIGDSRTGKLPQQILDAFSGSDALALECNPELMDEQMKDPDFAAEIASAYYYTDGTTAEDHISSTELYTYALALMKANGFCNYTLPHLKTAMWESNISKQWIRMCYGLAADKGVDFRLMQLAKEQNKPIREVESNLFQLKMMTGWSDPLAEMMLGATIAQPLDDYSAEMTELYELWCKGDEAALSAAVKTDTSEMTAEQKALWEEYRKAMETDRNKRMTDKAIEYLDSGDTVFYAVGFAHLLAEDGLVNTLRDAGYTVELVTYN